jgi:predicted  nucleic acid-binding Zn-ribbon protein
MLLNSGLFKSNEGMDNNSSTSTPTKKEEAAKNTLNKLKAELDKLTPDLNTTKTELAKVQTKIDLLSSQVQAKQSEIDKVQNQIDVDNLAKTA